MDRRASSYLGGKAFADSAREALDRIADAAEGLHLRQFRRLSVGVYGFFLSCFLLPMWPGLKAAHPELEIDLHTRANPVDLLASRYDAVIAVSDGEQRARLVTRPLLPIATVPVCSPAPLKRRMDLFEKTRSIPTIVLLNRCGVLGENVG